MCCLSTGGKSDSIQNLILKIYRGSFEIIYTISTRNQVDDTWRAVKKYTTDTMKMFAKEGKSIL